MKIILSKREFEEAAIRSLKLKYSEMLNPLSNEDIDIEHKYNGDVEINIYPKEAKAE